MSKVYEKVDGSNDTLEGTENIESSPGAETKKEKPETESSIGPAPFSAFFRFMSAKEIILLCTGIFFAVAAGAVMPSINIVFGEIIDSIASPADTENLINRAVVMMTILAGIGFVTFTLGFFCINWAASLLANNVRMAYLDAVLRQDAIFFDGAPPGSISLALSDAPMEIQHGFSDKFALAIQGVAQLIVGFGIAFYFGWQLSLVLLACVPFLALAAVGLMSSDVSTFGKDAYEEANEVALETLSNMRTIVSLNAEVSRAESYNGKLAITQTAAIRAGVWAAFVMGCLWLVMFSMYGLGFWYGAFLIAQSTDDAIQEHPAPAGLFNTNATESVWATHAYIIADVCSQYASDAAAYAICACGVPWAAIDMSSPECGCGYGALGDDLNVQSTCFTGGKTLLVFFSVLIGGFGIGQAGPGLAAMSKARVALAKLLRVINRTPAVDQRAPGTQRMGQVSGAIEISDLHFSYKRRVDAKELKDADISGPLKGTSKGVSKILPLDKKGSQGEGEGADAGADGYEMTAKVFEGLNISIKPGETVALVGESGCGKSTIAKLVQRFYDPDYGTISIDGKNLCDVSTDELRACIGVVSQEPFLFDVSISENIGFGKAGASQAEIEQAARQANAHDFICAMPDGYSTTVGPRGSKLSGGQKQRVAIARALLRDPAVLILDEATSALDNESERIVQEALDRVLQSSQAKRTTLVIAHRLSTVRNSDRILVLGSPEGTTTALKGSVVMEQGSHDELMKKNNGLYRALVAAGGGGGGEGTTAAPHDEPASVPEPKAAVAVAAADPVDAAPTAAETESIGKGTEKTAKDISEKVDSQGAKDKAAAPKIDTSRIWHYSAPEYPLIALGCVASACKGCIFPVSAVFFAEMINVWYESDTDALMAESLNWSYCFYGLAVFACVAEVAQKGIFQLVGERLTTRLRIDLFAAFLSQDIGWFELDGMTTTTATATATATANVTASTATEAKGKTDKTDLTSGSSASSGSSAPASGKGEEKASENNSVGALISRLSTDVYYVRLVTGQSVAATLETVAALTAGIVIACLASWEIFLVMLAMMPLLGMTEFFQWQALQNNDGSIREALKKCISTLNETVNGIREVQAFALQGKVREHIQSLLDENVSKASMANALYSGLMQGMIQLIQFGVYALAFYVGGQLIVAEQINFGDFNRALWAMAFAASGLGTAAQFAGDSAKASLIIKELLAIIDRKPWPIASEPWDRTLKQGKQPPELLGKPAPVRAVAQSPPGAISAEDLKAEAGFSEVHFSYPTRRNAPLFNGTSLTIHAGKTVAIVGSSGSGKSTVIQLLQRFYDPVIYSEDGDAAAGVTTEPATDSTSTALTKAAKTDGAASKGKSPSYIEAIEAPAAAEVSEDEARAAAIAAAQKAGKVSLDGQDLRTLDLRWVRQNMGLVGQEPVLFNMSVTDNIALGLSDANKRNPRELQGLIEGAARDANAHDFIMALADGYNTNIGPGGGKVSGGQKQRIAIARALIKQPRMLLLDEATSALDTESEKVVQRALDRLLQESKTAGSSRQRTTVIIAHRLSTIRSADVILVLDNQGDGSRVVEQGSHDSLMAINGKYKRLVEAYSQ